MSAPAAKAFSLPVMTMQPMPSSASKASSAAPSWSIRASFSALSCLGRFSVISPVRRSPSPRSFGQDQGLGHGCLQWGRHYGCSWVMWCRHRGFKWMLAGTQHDVRGKLRPSLATVCRRLSRDRSALTTGRMPSIFRKSAKGVTEIETRAHRLVPRLRAHAHPGGRQAQRR
jgi:hypothetical protein